MEHFGSICNNPLTKDISIILLMNKLDLFGQKLRKKRIKDVPEFFQYKPNGLIKDKRIHSFKTNLLDTEMTDDVILQCKYLCMLNTQK
jgi:hypothetical protein